MKSPNTWVAHGPTICADQVAQFHPAARSVPPLAGGELGAMPLERGDTLVLIDGYFRTRPAVRHEELIACTQRGVRIIGAASMGALRAAELADCGMQGYGAVYRWFRLGFLESDDEVAVVHDDSESAAPRTFALVNLRASCSRLARRGRLKSSQAQLLINAAKELPFYDRTWDRLGAAAVVPLPVMEMVRDYCRTPQGDVKFRDAAGALRHAARHPASERTMDLRSAGESNYASQWTLSRPQTFTSTTGRVFQASEYAVLEAAQLLLPDYDAIHLSVLSQLSAGAQPLTEARYRWSEKTCPDWRRPAVARLKLLGRWQECLDLYDAAHAQVVYETEPNLRPRALYMVLLAYLGTGTGTEYTSALRARGFDSEWRFADAMRPLVPYLRSAVRSRLIDGVPTSDRAVR